MKKIQTSFLCLLLIIFLSDAVYAVQEINIGEIKRPQSAILFIVDGLGSSYFYPELKPIALDGNELSKVNTPNLTFGSRVIDIKTPHPVTGIAHSVIVTGNSQANEEIVGYPDATIYDIAREHGFVNLAVMETGDFVNMREEQDIILFAENNSIDEPKISIQAKAAPTGIYELMYEWKMKVPEYLDNSSGEKKYSAYNKWGIDAANSVVTYMIDNHPTQKFLLTMNVGAIDSGGHNLGDDDYLRLIEDLDRDFYPIYKTARENNIALFLTADHGMSFAVKNARRGGHSSDKYASRQESLRIPFMIISSNVKSGLVNGEYGQEQIAPTLLSVLDLPNNLQYADGGSINVKNYASIFISSDGESRVSLWNNGKKVTEQAASELIFSGLPLNTSYTLKASGTNGNQEEHLFLDSDKQFNFNANRSSELNNKRLFSIILIVIINIAGLMVIRRIKD
ncbi:MAG TPA: alkaline phosphatase family protein [Thermodesulfovibrionales bacterium]|nr:alkaline phosphatase family protein [Thermodesulfovibrionales bacterium]